MWTEQFKDKEGKTKYRFYEKYKDPYTDKWRRVSVVMNKDTKASQKEAMFQLDDKINAKLANNYNTKLERLTIHDLLDEWFAYHKKTSGLKLTTLINLEVRIRNIKKYIDKSVIVIKLDSKYAQNFINELSEKLSENQIRRQLNDLKKALNYATKYYSYTNKHILDDIDIPKKAKTLEDIEKEEQKMYNYLEMEQVLQIRDFILNKKHSDKRLNFLVASIIELQALTGMRIGELQALQENDIDFKNKVIHINGTIHWLKYENGYGYKDTTKTKGSKRQITINQRSINILKKVILENKKLLQWNEGYINRGFIFTTRTGNPMYTHKINKQLADAAESLKINKKVTSHTFRHTHISFLVEMNVSLKAIMKRVGHTDEKTTIQIYTHVTEKMDKQLTEKLENIPS
ncbi:site-specific integrase [Staphylococcus xylosus]|uniref:tyrosine-type recombinase/integrase n=1 Tax=Staphylococcus xylosus TaxID=1288 RepID=UPI002DBF9657|nr:site-specific integrase [Staphylococcus xylosus]MEB8175562.1 site-specific integrase [Staphylococcus xylosus]